MSSAAADADITVALTEKHHPTDTYVQRLRAKLATQFPGTTFYTLPVDMVTQILNFGLPAPIDIQVIGNNLQGNREFIDRPAEGHQLCARHGRPAHSAAAQQSAFSDRCKPLQGAGYRA